MVMDPVRKPNFNLMYVSIFIRFQIIDQVLHLSPSRSELRHIVESVALDSASLVYFESALSVRY